MLTALTGAEASGERTAMADAVVVVSVARVDCDSKSALRCSIRPMRPTRVGSQCDGTTSRVRGAVEVPGSVKLACCIEKWIRGLDDADGLVMCLLP